MSQASMQRCAFFLTDRFLTAAVTQRDGPSLRPLNR
jgi:hypothetical protein